MDALWRRMTEEERGHCRAANQLRAEARDRAASAMLAALEVADNALVDMYRPDSVISKQVSAAIAAAHAAGIKPT